MLYALTLLAFLFAMTGMALAVLVGRRRSLERGCGRDCACLHGAGPSDTIEACQRRRKTP